MSVKLQNSGEKKLDVVYTDATVDTQQTVRVNTGLSTIKTFIGCGNNYYAWATWGDGIRGINTVVNFNGIQDVQYYAPRFSISAPYITFSGQTGWNVRNLYFYIIAIGYK